VLKRISRNFPIRLFAAFIRVPWDCFYREIWAGSTRDNCRDSDEHGALSRDSQKRAPLIRCDAEIHLPWPLHKSNAREVCDLSRLRRVASSAKIPVENLRARGLHQLLGWNDSTGFPDGSFNSKSPRLTASGSWGQSVSIVRRNVDNAGLSRRAVFKSERGQVKVFGTLRGPSHGRGVFGA
jgi:hypothetical protein